LALGTGVEKKHWLSRVRAFNSLFNLKDTIAVYSGGEGGEDMPRGVGREALKALCVRNWLLQLRVLAAGRSRHNTLQIRQGQDGYADEDIEDLAGQPKAQTARRGCLSVC